MSETVDINFRGFDALILSLTGPQPVARVGVMGGKVSRTEEKKTLTHAEVSSLKKPIRRGKTLNNAEIGAIHEFGDATHPRRSFLRVPIADHLQKQMEASGAFEEATLSEVVRTRSLLPFIRKMGVLGEKIVLGAFASGGYGKWASWSKGYSNNTGDILVDTTQLRNSITHEVVEET